MTKIADNKKKLATSRRNVLIWVAIAILFVLSIFANHYYSHIAWGIRASIGLSLLCVLAGMVMLTDQGVKIRHVLREAREELFRISWPAKDETIKITGLIVVFVSFMVVILWLLDNFLMWAVGSVTV